jgi:preprotein translocase subunit YajC
MHAFIVASGESNGSAATLPILMGLMLIVVYFMMIRPQRKRMREQAALQSSIGVGDEVVTNSGIFGFVTGIDGDRFWLEIDDDVQIRISRAAIQGKVNTNATSDTGDASESEKKRDSSGKRGEKEDS